MENDKCPAPQWEMDYWEYWNERGYYKENMEKISPAKKEKDHRHSLNLGLLANAFWKGVYYVSGRPQPHSKDQSHAVYQHGKYHHPNHHGKR